MPAQTRSALDLAEGFAERIPPLRPSEAQVEANRCLYCEDAPCMKACPTHIDIPSFIKKIASGNLKGSARVILESNILGGSCARVCPVDELCEGACVRNDVDHPIAIGRLQRYATDYISDRGIRVISPAALVGPAVAVAVVGAGPAGLACAAELARAGYSATVYDRRPAAGGLATYGIVPLREPMRVIRDEVSMIAGLGVRFLLGVEIGEDISISELIDAYSAVFLSVGAGGHTRRPAVDGIDLPGVYDALDLIAAVRTGPLEDLPSPRHVAVIGGGNTAMDALSIARRLGAERVTCLYRRSASEMTAYASEFAFVKAEEIEFRWMTTPTRFLAGEDGRLVAVECVQMRLGEPDGSGRPRPEVVPGSAYTLPVDMAVYATGQDREPGLFDELGLAHQAGRLLVDAETGATAHAKVFAGGDCVSSGADLTVVAAVAQGKRAARAIMERLGGTHG